MFRAVCGEWRAVMHRSHSRYQVDRLRRVQRHATQALKHQMIPVQILGTLQIEPAHQALDKHYTGRRSGELQDMEIAVHRRVRPRAEWYDLDRHVGQPRQFDEQAQLAAHDGRTAHYPVQHRLVEHHVEPQRRFPLEHLLPAHPDLDELLDPFGREVLETGLVHRLRVTWRLEQPVDNGGAEIADRHRGFLEPHIRREVELERLPPSLLLAFGREPGQVFALRWIGDLVQVAQIADVPCGGTALVGLHAAYLGR